MKSINLLLTVASLNALTIFGLSIPSALAQDQIIRPYMNVRSLGMGGVHITTGLYDQNFFGNPARVTENPKWKVQVFDITAETTGTTLGNVSKIISDSENALQNLAGSAGSNNHIRLQTAFPSFYIPRGKMSFAFGILSNTQVDLKLRRSYNMNPMMVMDIGPAFTVGRKFLENDALSVGLTLHGTYRVASTEGFTLVDLIQGKSLSPGEKGGDGGHVDASLGAYYKLPQSYREWTFSTGFSINNLLGGKYNFFSLNLLDGPGAPPPQPRAFNVGFSAQRSNLWKFTDTVLALEFTDIGNNPGGSLFRLIHLGGETRYGILAIRAGFNQGYLAGGFGLDFKFATLDFATYGEELSLNAGGLQDRRFTLRLGFQI